MNRIILIRHCQSAHHVDTSAGPDSDLTDLGRRQAAAIAARLMRDLAGASCRLYTSDLKRAAQTAKAITQALGLTATAAVELREGYSAPRPNNRPEPAGSGGDARTQFLFDSRPAPEIETWREFHARVCTFMDGLVDSLEPGQMPIVVTHGGTMSNIVTWWLRLPLDVLPERTPFAASPASISVLRRNQYDNPVIERLNDISHLYQAGLADGRDIQG